MLKLAIVGGVILFTSLSVSWLINRDLQGSLGRLMATIHHLASGDLEAPISGTGRHDEVGDMAATVMVFGDKLVEATNQHAA